MNTRSTQPFGRRGRAPTPVVSSNMAAADVTAPSRQTKPLPPDIVATLLRPEGVESVAYVRGAGEVRRSFRAAILAGLVVAILDAAANATFAASATAGLNDFSLGSAQVPVAVTLLIGALWSGGSSSAACLLVAHRLLTRVGRTSHIDYALGGAAAALALAAIMFVLGSAPGPAGLGITLFSGMVAGFFYRLFAGTTRQDA